MDVAGCSLPEDRLYDLEQEVWWLNDPEDGTARVGVLSTVGAFAGIFRQLTFRPVEGPLARGRSVATIESPRLTGAVRLPVDATIVERNARAAEHPRLLNDAPYSDGWVVRVRPRRPEEVASALTDAASIAPRFDALVRQRRIRCWPQTPDAELIEVGVECTAVLVRLNEELARTPAGSAFLLVTDDPTAPIEMIRWADRYGHTLLAHRTEEGLHKFLIRKEATPRPRRRGEDGVV